MKNKIILAILILSMIVLVFSGCGGGGSVTPPIPDEESTNHNPIISDLSASPRTAFINQTSTITCTASDQDGDTLTYSWSKTGGTINGIGSTITWKSPSTEGTYTITCTVSDGKGGEDNKSVDIVVAVNGVEYRIPWSKAESNGWANPLGEGKELFTSATCDYDSGIYLYKWGKKHMGIDIGSGENDDFYSKEDDDVYPIAGGTVAEIERGSDTMKMVVIIKHTNSDKEDFFAIYGHVLARDGLKEGDPVNVGKEIKEIGKIKTAGSGPHLHFGINLSSKIDDFKFITLDGVEYGWGRIPASANPSDYDWVDPIDYLNNHLPLPEVDISVGDIIVEFEDPNLEQVVRETIGKPEGSLYLSDVIEITILDAEERGIKSLKGIQHLQNLLFLDFGENQVTDISAVENLTNLQDLEFYTNQVTDISAVENLTNLHDLSFIGNQVTDISAVENLTNLQHLRFHTNQVTDISAVENLTNLHDLNFSGNQVTDITVLENLTNLRSLGLQHNQVTDISALGNLTNLNYLIFSHNQVTDITVLENLTNLKWLYFYYNQVTDISALVENEGLGTGD
jgi:Leucine-rich repeat (LRR) protein